MTDPISDLLTRIRNAGMRKTSSVDAPYSKIKEEIVKILLDEKFINDYKVVPDESTGRMILRIDLKYVQGVFAIQNLKRISKPGIRTYAGYTNVPRVRGGYGICILSTSQGVLTGADAKAKKVGGEVLCTIY